MFVTQMIGLWMRKRLARLPQEIQFVRKGEAKFGPFLFEPLFTELFLPLVEIGMEREGYLQRKTVRSAGDHYKTGSQKRSQFSAVRQISCECQKDGCILYEASGLIPGNGQSFAS